MIQLNTCLFEYFSYILLIILFILFFLSLFISLLIVQGAIIHYEYNHSKLKTAFEFRLILIKLKSMGLIGRYTLKKINNKWV
jgi:hypothetical protein